MSKGVVLVIEDNIDNLDLVRFLLEEGGFEVLTAMDGRDGLSAAREKLPDLILLDLAIPEIDGWDVAQSLKKDPATAGIFVVAMTAHILPGDRKRALDAGCDAYISKPLDVPTFAETIAGYIRSKPAAE